MVIQIPKATYVHVIGRIKILFSIIEMLSNPGPAFVHPDREIVDWKSEIHLSIFLIPRT